MFDLAGTSQIEDQKSNIKNLVWQVKIVAGNLTFTMSY